MSAVPNSSVLLTWTTRVIVLVLPAASLTLIAMRLVPWGRVPDREGDAAPVDLERPWGWRRSPRSWPRATGRGDGARCPSRPRRPWCR